MAEKKQNSAIIYDGWRDSAVLLAQQDKSLAYDYLMAILDTQFYGERDKSNPILEAMMVNVDFSLLRSAKKMTSSSNGGIIAAHNRKYPYALLYHLKTHYKLSNDEIVDIIGCSTRTITNAITEINRALENGATVEGLMEKEQEDEKYADYYEKYFAFLQSRLL